MPKDQKSKSLWDYFISCITKKYFCFQGRANRKEFWGFFALYFLFSIMLVNIELNIMIIVAIMWIMFIPFVAVSVRRLHDINISGAWLFLCLPCLKILQRIDAYPEISSLIIFISIAFIIIFCLPGSVKPNDYGPVPD
jgi:uncharacterized membrane protein YhaH (DUF805 family)